MALGICPGFTDWALKHVEHVTRSGLTVVERRSGRPHFWAVEAPPESKADIDPTAANVSAQARA